MSKFPFPRWIEAMPKGIEKERAKNRFILRLCCLYAHPNGRIHDLANMLGMNENTLKTQMQSNRIVATEETKERIKYYLGPDFVPPDINVM